MSIEYYIRCGDAAGRHLQTIRGFGSVEGAGLDYHLNVGEASALRTTIPRALLPSVNPRAWFPVDGRIGVWRSVDGRSPQLDHEAVFLCRYWKLTRDSLTIGAQHANTLLDRRFIAYAKKSTFTNKVAAATANQVRTLWLENFGASISAANRFGVETGADISAYVRTGAATGSGLSQPVDAGGRMFSAVARDLEITSSNQGTYVISEIIAPSEGDLLFQSFTGARGVDRRRGTTNQVILSESNGCLSDVEVEEDRTQEATVVMALGAGNDDLRLVQVAVDTTRMAESPLNRIERVIDTSFVDDTALLNAARSGLQAARPRITMSANILQAGRYIRGIHYDVGDIISAEAEDLQFDCRLNLVHVSVGYQNQSETTVLRSI